MRLRLDRLRGLRALELARPFYWREAALCVPAIPLLLIVGMATDHTLRGLIAAGAAFSVGFGAARDLRGRRWAAMLTATLGMTLAAFTGSLAGQWLPALTVIAAAAAAACAACALYDEDLWWVVLQVVVALLIAGYYPGGLHPAFGRAETVLAGGAVQMATVILLARLAPSAAFRLPPPSPKPPPETRLLVAHVLRAALCVALSLDIAQSLGLANSYWAPMTAMIVLKPGLSDTQARGLARLVGTLAGCAVASLFAIAVGYAAPALLFGMALAAGSAFALQKAHYALLTLAITAAVVLLLSMARGGALLNAEHRIVATLIGGVIALTVARIAPHGPRAKTPALDHVGA